MNSRFAKIIKFLFRGGITPATRIAARQFPLGALLLVAGVVCGQTFPNKPVRLVTSEAGGGNDFAARLIAQGFSGSFGQRVIVDNRGVVAAEIVAKAPPDGYTLLLFGDPFWLAPYLRDNVPYDPVRDFAPISLAVNVANILVVHPSLPARSVRELIALAKARPAELNYSTGTTGSTTHLAAELFAQMANVNIVRVPYRGTGPALSGFFAGQVEVMFPTVGTVMPHLKSSRLRALAITTARPSRLLPDLPTVAATVPGYEAVAKTGIFAPAKTPEAIVNLLNEEFVRVLNQADVKERFFNAGIDTIGSSPEQLAAAMKSEMARMGRLIKGAGLREP